MERVGVDGYQWFKFGGGKICKVKTRVMASVEIGGKGLIVRQENQEVEVCKDENKDKVGRRLQVVLDDIRKMIPKNDLNWFNNGGMMLDKVWSECDGEFNLGMLEDLCESLGIEVHTSNAVVERHYAFVDRIWRR